MSALESNSQLKAIHFPIENQHGAAQMLGGSGKKNAMSPNNLNRLVAFQVDIGVE